MYITICKPPETFFTGDGRLCRNFSLAAQKEGELAWKFECPVGNEGTCIHNGSHSYDQIGTLAMM